VKDFPTDKKKVGAGGKVIENFSMVSVALDVAESCKTWNCPSPSYDHEEVQAHLLNKEE
jgi:hypothetical protein